jgi:hypothetical protein
LSKWAFALAGAVVVAAGVGGVGCAGGGGSTTTTGTGGNNGDSTAFVTIPNTPGVLQNVYLTGQGRAFGDLIAVMRRVSIDDGGPAIQTLLNPLRRLQLNGFTQQMILLNVPSTVSRKFDHYNLEVQELDVDNGDGTFTSFTGLNQPLVQDQFEAYFRILPGRTSSITVRLDDSMFNLNGSTYDFDRNQFILANYSQFGLDPLRMNGFISDYLMFDLSNLANPGDAPPFPDASGTASAVFINGDNFAVGTIPDGPPDNSTPDPKPFFTLTPIGYVEGSHVGPRTAIDPSTGQSTIIPGTYSLVQADPRPPANPAARITALQGTYKNFTKTLNSLGTNAQGFEIVAFPGTYTDDSGEGGYGQYDVLLFNIAGGQITKMFFGQIDVNTGHLSAFPIGQVSDPSNINNEITGTVSAFVDAGGSSTSDVSHIRAGHYTIDAGPNVPASFSASGRFIVYRR